MNPCSRPNSKSCVVLHSAGLGAGRPHTGNLGHRDHARDPTARDERGSRGSVLPSGQPACCGTHLQSCSLREGRRWSPSCQAGKPRLGDAQSPAVGEPASACWAPPSQAPESHRCETAPTTRETQVSAAEHGDPGARGALRSAPNKLHSDVSTDLLCQPPL